jgi:hypothetical protein
MKDDGAQQKRILTLVVCAVGIFICYIIYGGLQERMYVFDHSQFLWMKL